MRSPAHPSSTPAGTRPLPAGGLEDSPLLARVLQAATALDGGHEDTAQSTLDALLAEASPTGSSSERVARLFALALHARMAGAGEEAGNLYLEGPGPRDMLAAFQVLVTATPFTRFGYASVNSALAEALADERSLHLIDIGIGMGSQWTEFLDALAARPDGPPRLRLTGIDLPVPGDDPAARLREVGDTLAAHARRAGVPFAFDAVAAPIEAVDLARLPVQPGDAVAVNAAFALHHVPTGDHAPEGPRERDAVLRRILALRPKVLTLVEPDVEHNAPPFLPRVRESLRHYRLVFEAMEALLPRELEARATLEEAFFGREIFNVVGSEGPGRVERHERHSAWGKRLLANGFHPLDLSPHAPVVEAALGTEPPFSVDASEGTLLLAYRHEPVVAASAWTAVPE